MKNRTCFFTVFFFSLVSIQSAVAVLDYQCCLAFFKQQKRRPNDKSECLVRQEHEMVNKSVLTSPVPTRPNSPVRRTSPIDVPSSTVFVSAPHRFNDDVQSPGSARSTATYDSELDKIKKNSGDLRKVMSVELDNDIRRTADGWTKVGGIDDSEI